jgi:hypothetical protein
MRSDLLSRQLRWIPCYRSSADMEPGVPAKSPDLPEKAANFGLVRTSGLRRLEIAPVIPLVNCHTTIAEVWGAQSLSRPMSNSQQVTEQRRGRTGYDLRPS